MSTASLPRPAEKTAILSLLLVFLCGGVLGAVVMSYVHPRLHMVRPAAPIGLAVSVSQWKKQLNLSEEQERKLTSVLDDFSRYYDNVLADGNSRVLEILTPEQRTLYEGLLRAHRNK